MQSYRAPPPAPPRRNPHTMPNNPGTRQPFVRGKAAATPDRSVDWPGFECPAAACKPKRVRSGRAATRRRDVRAYAQAARETPPVRGMGACAAWARARIGRRGCRHAGDRMGRFRAASETGLHAPTSFTVLRIARTAFHFPLHTEISLLRYVHSGKTLDCQSPGLTA